jgi:MmeI, DNA-methyltransferase domain/MmeI, helicase spacer domain/MmeI, N-terminal domain
MTWAEFKRKWSRYTGTETSAYQEHFNDLCRLLDHPTPVEADPSGTEFFCFQKQVIKDLGRFATQAGPDEGDPKERGVADVWKKDFFGWEYKGKKKSLDAAYRQLQRYREALLNPPLLVVCDFDRYIIRTNFNGTAPDTHEFTNDQIDRPENLRVLRMAFDDPEYLKPQRTTAQVTTKLAEDFAAVARSLQKRESVELADARTRAEVSVAHRKSLRIARFLNRLVFCFFAEDTGLLPKHLFSEMAKVALEDPHRFSQALESLFRIMATGGMFGYQKIRHFNGHLFEDATVFELNDVERRILAEAAEADWQCVEPSIMGTLFARGLDPGQRAALGAQYTSRPDIVTLVEPVLMAPLRREWAALKAGLLPAAERGKVTPAERARLEAFLKQLRKLVVMDPACGSGNFLYVSLQMLLDLEKEVINFAIQLGLRLMPEVGVHQLRAFEINPYAYELAQVTVQIGCLQWRRDNGFPNDRTPVLQNLDGFHNEDALLVPHYHSKARTLKEAQAGEHLPDDSLRFYTERHWPECDVLVGNPPFLGDKVMRRELGHGYVDELRRVYGNRIPGQSDLCCYWFEKARHQIESRKCKRAGLLATQGIRHGANREVLKRIKQTGDIFFAVSDQKWVLSGANVNVSMAGFDDGSERLRHLDGKPVEVILPNLTGSGSQELEITSAQRLAANEALCFVGVMKGGPFDLTDAEGLPLLAAPNPHGKPNSDVLRARVTAFDILRRGEAGWIIDFGVASEPADCAGYEAPWKYVTNVVKPVRDSNRRKRMAERWWIHGEARPGMRRAIAGLSRLLVTPEVSKHRIFVWLPTVFLPDHKLRVIASDSDYWFGVLHCHLHEVWALRQGSRLQTRPCYTPTTCFETFPFPFPEDLLSPEPGPDRFYAEMLAAKNYFMGKEEPPPYGTGPRREEAQSSPPITASAVGKEEHRTTIAAAAKELNDLRERWLNPPEWTVERILEFPGSVDGPWSRYVVNPEANGIGTVRYPRLEPRDPDCAAKLKQRTLTKLYNERPTWLDLAHKKLDVAVAAAYGWPADLSDEQVLERLLGLNLERAAAEAGAAKASRPGTMREKHADEML